MLRKRKRCKKQSEIERKERKQENYKKSKKEMKIRNNEGKGK